MLKVNVGLSRKLTEDFNSHGFSIHLEGELGVDPSDAEQLVDRIQEFYDLSEEALLRQIERYESDTALASRDAEPVPLKSSSRNGSHAKQQPPAAEPAATRSGELATNKQVQFLLTLGKRQSLSKAKLEARIAEILGQPIGVYELTKRDAGVVLDALTAESNGAGSRR